MIKVQLYKACVHGKTLKKIVSEGIKTVCHTVWGNINFTSSHLNGGKAIFAHSSLILYFFGGTKYL